MSEGFIYVALAIPIAGFSLIAVLIQKTHMIGLTTAKYSLILPLLGSFFVVLEELFVLFESYNYFTPELGIELIFYLNQYSEIVMLSSIFLLLCCECSSSFNLQRLENSHIVTIELIMCISLLIAMTDTFSETFGIMLLCSAQTVLIVTYLLSQSVDVYHLNFKKIKRQIKYFEFKGKLDEDLQSYHLCHLHKDGIEQEASGEIVSMHRYLWLPRDYFPLCQGIPSFVVLLSVLLFGLGLGNVCSQKRLANIMDEAEEKIDKYLSYESETTAWAYNLVQAENIMDLIEELWLFIFPSLNFVVIAVLTTYFTINSQPEVDDIFKNRILFELFMRWMYATDTQSIAEFLIEAMRLRNEQKIDFQQFDLFCIKYKALLEAGHLPLSDLAIEEINQNLEQLEQGYNTVETEQEEDEMQLVNIQRFEYEYKNIRQSKYSLVNKVFYLGEMELSLYICELGYIFLNKDIDMFLYEIFNETTRKEEFKELFFGGKRKRVAKELYYDYGALNEIYDFDYETKKNYIFELYEHHKWLIHEFKANGAVSNVLDFEFDANIFAYFEGVGDIFQKMSHIFDHHYDIKITSLEYELNETILNSIHTLESVEASVNYTGPEFVHFRGFEHVRGHKDINTSRSLFNLEQKITYAREMSYFLSEIEQTLDEVPRPEMALKAKGSAAIGTTTIMDHLRNEFSNYYCEKVRTPLPRGEIVINGAHYNLLNLQSNCTMYERKVIAFIEMVANDIRARDEAEDIETPGLDDMPLKSEINRNQSTAFIKSLEYTCLSANRVVNSEKSLKVDKPYIRTPNAGPSKVLLLDRIGGESQEHSSSSGQPKYSETFLIEPNNEAGAFSIVASRRLSLCDCERGNGNDQLFAKEFYDAFNSNQFSVEQLDEISAGNALLLTMFLISEFEPLIDFPDSQFARFLLLFEIENVVQPKFRLRVAWLIHKAYLLQRELTRPKPMRKLRPHFIAICLGICGFYVAETSAALEKAYMYYRPEYCLAANTLGHIYSLFSKNEAFKYFWAYSNSCVHYFMEDADFLEACTAVQRITPSVAINVPFFEFFYLFFLMHFAAEFDDIVRCPEEHEWFYGLCDYFHADLSGVF